jgi:hypothetical protein
MRHLAFAFVTLFWATSAVAQAQVSIAMDRLGIADMIAVMRVEGIAYADTLNDEMLDGQGGALWDEQVRSIYAVDPISETVRARLATLSDTDLRAANVFFGSDVGRKVIALDLAARRAMLDETLEEIVRAAYVQAVEEDAPALSQMQRLVESSDMIERNVTITLTSSYRMYKGLVDGGAYDMSDDEILAEVWTQEDDVRADTTEWLMGYLMLSYQPLDAADLEVYLTFSESTAGRALNAAYFDGFGIVYTDISYALGRAVALNMIGDEL